MPTNPLTGSYRTSDGRYLAFSMLQAFEYWPEFCERIGRPELVEDPRFASAPDLAANASAASELVAAEIGSRTVRDWRDRLTGMAGQWAVVQDTVEVIQDPQTLANGYVQTATSADGTAFQLVAPPVQFDELPSPTKRAPEFNEHGDAILVDELGMDWDTVVDLKVRGIVA
jgi:crotonobetainyl-CoA:carnitine CoA-transferase CaiB-like acyl-CoA transferase